MADDVRGADAMVMSRLYQEIGVLLVPVTLVLPES